MHNLSNKFEKLCISLAFIIRKKIITFLILYCQAGLSLFKMNCFWIQFIDNHTSNINLIYSSSSEIIYPLFSSNNLSWNNKIYYLLCQPLNIVFTYYWQSCYILQRCKWNIYRIKYKSCQIVGFKWYKHQIDATITVY